MYAKFVVKKWSLTKNGEMMLLELDIEKIEQISQRKEKGNSSSLDSYKDMMTDRID